MSFAVTPAQPKPRPTTVTAAVYLLYLLAAMEVITIVLALSSFGTIKDVYEDAYRGTDQEDTATTMVNAITIGSVVVGLLLAVGFIILAILNGKGKNPARIVTWVLAGLAVLCFSCGAISQAGAFGSMGGDNGNGPDPAEVQRRVEDALPSWQGPVSLLATVLSILALLLVIVFLALPASNAFFRKEQEVWVPPTEWPASGGMGDVPPPPPPGGSAPPPLT